MFHFPSSIMYYQIVTIPLHKRLTMIRGVVVILIFELTRYSSDTWDCYVMGVILLYLSQLLYRGLLDLHCQKKTQYHFNF